MKDSVLVLTNSEDESAEFVIRELAKLGVPYYRFDTERYPAEISLDLRLANVVTGKLRDGSCEFDLERIRSVWYRRPVRPILPETLADGYIEYIRKEAGAAMWSLYTCLEAFWVNQPVQSNAVQHNKLYQLKVASRVGWKVPDTLITNRVEELAAFADAHGGEVALKMLKGGFFVKEGDVVPHFIFTQLVPIAQILERGADIAFCPVFAQEYIPKRLELRVTVVGSQIFACAIHSQDSPETTVDWRRYDFRNVKHEPFALPLSIQQKLLAVMSELKIVYGAVDLILTPSGEFVFLEVNESGQWVWIEQMTGMPISRGIAELLAAGSA